MAKKVIETSTGSRSIHGVAIATQKWSPSRVRYPKKINDTNLDAMDDCVDGLEKIDNKKEENNTIETPAVIVTVTVDTSGSSSPQTRRMTFTGSPKRLLTRVEGFLKTIVTPKRHK